MKDTRDSNGGKSIQSLAASRDYDQGMKYVWLKKNMGDAKRQQLAKGMKQSEKGRQQLTAFREVIESFGSLTDGGTFRLPEDEFNQYMKDGEA